MLLVGAGCSRCPDNARGPHICSAESMLKTSGAPVFVSQRGGHDVTAEFTQRFCAGCNSADRPSALAFDGCDVLLVHGWLGEVAIRVTGLLDNVSCNQRVLDYLKDQHCAADELGLCSFAPPYRSESVCACGEKVARMIECNPRPVMIVSHSKGCLDTLEALLILQREGKLGKVAGWIALQGPFYGAALAESFLGKRSPIGRLRVRMLGADLEGIRDMTETSREGYMARNATETEKLVRAIPVLCFASWKTPLCDGYVLTDGQVTPESALLPGADYVALGGITHAMPVIGRKYEPFDRVTFTKTLLTMLRDRSAARH